MYDPTPLASYYAQRAQGFAKLASDESSSARPIYLRLAETFSQLAASAHRFAAELRGEAFSDRSEGSATPLPEAITKRSKRKSALRKSALAKALPPSAVTPKPLQESGPKFTILGDESRH
jgi:hypothetical protein